MLFPSYHPSLLTLHLPLPHRVAVAIHCEALWTLARDFSLGYGPVSSSPPSVQRELMNGLVMCGIGERKEEFLTKVGECGVCVQMLHVCVGGYVMML